MILRNNALTRTLGILISLCVFLVHSPAAAQGWQDTYSYVFPGPGSEYVHPGTTIILRFNNLDPLALENLHSMIRVRGDWSGDHPGRTHIASDGQTLIFTPEEPLLPGERVDVSIQPECKPAQGITGVDYSFGVLESVLQSGAEPREPIAVQEEKGIFDAGGRAFTYPNGVSVPGDFPRVNILENNNPSQDYIYLNNWGPPNYNIIFNTDGEPVFYLKTPDRRRDFKVQSNGWITMLVRDGYGGSGEGYIAFDENFEYIKSMRTGNGYSTDEHELFMLSDSGYFLIGRRETTVDMSQYVPGGKEDAVVRECCIQEFTAEDEMIFIWRAWDHFDIRDLDLEDPTSRYIRFPHMNAVYTDEDDHILLSSRHLSEISKIDRHTGAFIWRLCGVPESPNNDFQFVNDTLNGFRNQHAVRATGNNRYTLFDNGNMHAPPVSRGVEYELDTQAMIATLVWDQRNGVSEEEWSHYMGNAQRLENGNSHINWAVGRSLPVASEYTPQGEALFHMQFEKGYHCYRSFRHPWEGKLRTPYLLYESQPDGPVLIFNKFGDDDVDYYKIYGGPESLAATLVDTSQLSMKFLKDLANGTYYFRVTSVDKNGSESDFSNEVSLTVNSVQPGVNLIRNGDFSASTQYWVWEVTGEAQSTIEVPDGVCHFAIQNGGSEFYNIQLRQNGIPLYQGESYTFEFDAWSDASRIAEIKVGQDDAPFTNYSKIGYSAITSKPKHFSFDFTMEDYGDDNARVVINGGIYPTDLYFDNFSLILNGPGTSPEADLRDGPDQSLYNYPNPFRRSTTIRYEIFQHDHVILRIFNSLGEPCEVLLDQMEGPGVHELHFDASKLQPGVYFCQLISGGKVSTRKMLIMGN